MFRGEMEERSEDDHDWEPDRRALVGALLCVMKQMAERRSVASCVSVGDLSRTNGAGRAGFERMTSGTHLELVSHRR